jgi:hypothetical protein
MSIFAAVVLGVSMGIVFGFSLEKSRVFEPGMILGQMQLRNFIMLKVFLAAVATGLVVLAVLQGGFGIKLHPKATFYSADVVGGLMLGAGIALAGACPGTVLAQVGAGYKDAWFTLAGGLAGALAFVYTQPQLKPVLSGGPGAITLDRLTGIPFWVLASAFAVLWIGALAGLESWRSWRDDLGSDHDGDFGEPPARPGIPRALKEA